MYYIDNYLIQPTHRIDIVVVGVGGTGSFVLAELAALSYNLKLLERKELKITVYDPDIVEEHNAGRQKFFPCDVGRYKAEVLANRINRAYGTDIDYENRKVRMPDLAQANIVITCVDSVSVRKVISKHLRNKPMGFDYAKTYYWFDCGNSRDFGQIIMAAYARKKSERLPSVIELHPTMKDDPKEPSCSLRESLMEQSFMVNKITGVLLLEMLSTLLLDYNLTYSEVYFNLTQPTVKTNKI